MKNSHRIVFVLALVLLLVPSVIGISIADSLSKTLGQFKGIEQLYPKYYAIIDAIFYFILFIGTAKTALGEKYKENKSVPTMIGVILAVSMMVFEYKSHFNLGQLAPFAALILILLGVKYIHGQFKDSIGNTAAWTLAIVIFAILLSLIPSMNAWVSNHSWANTTKNIILIIGVGMLIMMAGKFIKGINTGENAFKRATRHADDAEQREKKDKKNEEKVAEKILNLDSEAKQFQTKISEMENLENQLENADLTERKNQLQFLQQLEQTLEGTWKYQEGLRRLHANISKPQYQAQREKVDEYYNAFGQYLGRISNILTQMLKHIQYNRDNSDSKLGGIEAEFDKDLTILLNDNIKLTEEISKEIEALKGTQVYPELFEEFKKLKEDTLTSIRSDSDVKKEEKKVRNILKKIHDADVKNYNDIEKANRILQEKKQVEPLTIMNRAGRAVTFGLIKENSLKEISELVKQVKGNLEWIIAMEDTNGQNFIKDKEAKMKNISQLQLNNNIRYSEFEKKVIKKTKEMYNIENKLFIEKAAILIQIAQTLKADPKSDAGMKTNDIDKANIAIVDFIQGFKTSKFKNESIVEPLIDYANSLSKMIKNFQTKDGKVNSKTQALLAKFIAGLSTEIENIKKDIVPD